MNVNTSISNGTQKGAETGGYFLRNTKPVVSESPFGKVLEIGSYTVRKAEPLEKVAKNAYRLIDMWVAIFGSISKPFAALSSQLKDSVLVFESIRVFGSIRLLIVKDEDGKYFLANDKNSWQKRVDRVCLAVHNTFKSVKVASKAGLMQLGVLAKNGIGKLPVFTLVMDSFMIMSSFFSTLDTVGKGLPKGKKALDLADSKIAKWEARPMAISLLRVNDDTTLRQFEEKYQDKAVSITKKLDDKAKALRLKEEALQKILDPNATALSEKEKEKVQKECEAEIEKLQTEMNKLQTMQAKNSGRLEMLAKNELKKLADELDKTAYWTDKGQEVKKWEFKAEQWQVKHDNNRTEQNKNWVRVANSVGKMAVIIFALTLVALDAWALPCVLSLLVFGFIVDSIGLTKILYEEFGKPAPIPMLPATA